MAGFDGGRVSAQLEHLLLSPGLGAGWIAVADGVAVGYLLVVYVFSLENLGDTAEIDEFYVSPAIVDKASAPRCSCGPRPGWRESAAPLQPVALCMHIATMGARTVTIRDLPQATLHALRARALANHRSLNGELLSIIESAVAAARSRPAGRVRDREAPPCRPTVDRAALTALCRRHHIRWLAMFGSTARGEAGPESDVDLVADFEPGMTPGLGIIRVAEALRPAFGGRPVDLVTRRGLSPRLRDRVLAEAVPLHGA